MTQNFQWKHMTMGVCYYPEHWPRSLWESDLERMQAAGVSYLRSAEFAWSLFEPEEGVFCFSLFDDFLALCAQRGMGVILGTPTATPPAWLTEKYPEVLNRNREGVAYRHGGRRHYTYNAPVYQNLCARVVEKLAERYGGHPAVIGWQIDNEINCETDEFYAEADHAAFRVFLQGKYGSLEELNRAWGTTFWSQVYSSWDQVCCPRPVLNHGLNPHLHLDYFRFVSASAVRFCKMQADIVRKYKKPGDFITTNGLFGNLDNHEMAQCLDIYTYDSYPNMELNLDQPAGASAGLRDRQATRKLIETRSVCPHFGIMEQQSGANGWTTRMESPSPKPGQLTLWAMQSVAQGADSVSFFRWRTCTFGTEMYWHGILDYDNRDNRKLAEVKDFYQKLKALDCVCGAESVPGFLLLKDYDNVWDAQVDAWRRRVSDWSEQEIFAAAELNHTPYNIVYLSDRTGLPELQSCPVAIYPHPAIMTERRAALLRSYVEQGGTLIIGCRAGYKDESGQCVMAPQPGLLADLTGTDVKEFTYIAPDDSSVCADWAGTLLETPVCSDVLDAVGGAKVLAVYRGSCYAGRAALTEKALGRGRTLHFGSAFSRNSAALLLRYAGALEPFSDCIEGPECVEIVLREKEGCRFFFALNFQDAPADIVLKQPMKLLYSGETQSGSVTLPAFGTAVYQL